MVNLNLCLPKAQHTCSQMKLSGTELITRCMYMVEYLRTDPESYMGTQGKQASHQLMPKKGSTVPDTSGAVFTLSITINLTNMFSFYMDL